MLPSVPIGPKINSLDKDPLASALKKAQEGTGWERPTDLQSVGLWNKTLPGEGFAMRSN